MSEGPLDLTVPLDFAEIRAALSSTSGSIPAVRDASAAAPASAPREPGARRAHRHTGSKRLGKIAAFVAVAAALSVGTACALVLSTPAPSGSSVSLPPTTGNIPVAPSSPAPQQGQVPITSGSTSASATPSLSHSPSPTPTTASPSATATTNSASPSSSASASASISPTPSDTSPTSPPATDSGSPPYGSNWVTLYWGIQDEQQEVSKVQSLLASIGYLQPWHHRQDYYNPNAQQSDQSGVYESATEDAVAQFQQDYGVDFSGQPGTCDLATYNALVQAAGGGGN